MATAPATPSIQTCTLAEEPSTRCRRPACGGWFTPRASGRRQEFCSSVCRLAFHAEARRVGTRALRLPRIRPKRLHGYWKTGLDVATGRRIPVVIKTPREVLVEGVSAEAGDPGSRACRW